MLCTHYAVPCVCYGNRYIYFDLLPWMSYNRICICYFPQYWQLPNQILLCWSKSIKPPITNNNLFFIPKTWSINDITILMYLYQINIVYFSWFVQFFPWFDLKNNSNNGLNMHNMLHKQACGVSTTIESIIETL